MKTEQPVISSIAFVVLVGACVVCAAIALVVTSVFRGSNDPSDAMIQQEVGFLEATLPSIDASLLSENAWKVLISRGAALKIPPNKGRANPFLPLQ